MRRRRLAWNSLARGRWPIDELLHPVPQGLATYNKEVDLAPGPDGRRSGSTWPTGVGQKAAHTETEWEFNARGGLSGKVYPWGDEFLKDGRWMTNSHQGHFPIQDTGDDQYEGIAPVAQFPPNGYGFFDMAGNVWEWTSDWYRPDYYTALATSLGVARNPQGPPSSFDPSEPSVPKRVHSGGSFLCTDQYCSRYMVGTRGKGEGSTGANHLGFRLVKSAGGGV